jgi:DNA-binding XRE family transcriptional regulator
MAKSKWEEVKDKLILVEGWARDGLTDEQIAKNLGISRDTLYVYKKEHPDFSDALKRGKEVVDREVENSLLNNALGYDYTEQQAIKVKEVYYDTQGKRCENEEVKIIEITKHKPAETTATIFWLKNRKPEQWRDKTEVESNNTNDTTVRIKLEGELKEWAK